MKSAGIYLFFIGLIFLILPLFYGEVIAASIVIKNNGDVNLINEDGDERNISQGYGAYSSWYDGNVLGSSAGVTITVSVSSLLPTDTPIPTATNTPAPTATNTPTPTSSSGSSSPTNTPTPTRVLFPTSSPTPSGQSSIVTPISGSPTGDGLLVVVTNPTSSTSQYVDEVIVEGFDGTGDIVIAAGINKDEMLIAQGNIQIKTKLPVTIDTAEKNLSILIKGMSFRIISPKQLLESISEIGGYLVGDSVKINLIDVSGDAIYRITGKEKAMIINLFVWEFPVTIDVYAKTGKIVRVKESVILSVLEFLHLAKKIIQ